MTIAACYVSSEGVVLGADSTSSVLSPSSGHLRHYNFAQKIFELGQPGSSLGIVTWGIGGFNGTSYRLLAAMLADELAATPPRTVKDVAERWCAHFWTHYTQGFAQQIQRVRHLASLPSPTLAESQELEWLKKWFFVGFFIGGHAHSDRRPSAFCCEFDLTMQATCQPAEVPVGTPQWKGVPNLINRLIYGIDDTLYERLASDQNWTGGKATLEPLVNPFVLKLEGELPLREVIDWLYSSIFVTIKALKFSNLPPLCGGPIEIAVVSVDRPFRWVCHKSLADALLDHSPHYGASP